MVFSQRNAILIVSCMVFLSLGVMSAAIGPNLTGLADQTSISLETAGAVFTGLFLGALIAQIASGPILDRTGQKKGVLIGSLLLATGTLVMTFTHQGTLLLIAACLAGLGHGSVDLAGNVWIAQVYKDKSVSALNLLNFFFGLGGFIGPAFAGLALNWWGTALPALWLSVGLLGLAVPSLALVAEPESLVSRDGQPNQDHSKPFSRLYTSLPLWLLGGLILVYVGAENGMGGWTSTIIERSNQVSTDKAALVTSFFWLALTFGRMISAALGLRVSAGRLLNWHLIGACVGAGLFYLGRDQFLLSIAAVGIIGFCFGPTYPTVMAILAHTYENEASRAVGMAAAMGSVGGMLLPWLQGVILERAGIGSTIIFTLLAALSMTGLAAAFTYRSHTHKDIEVVRLEEL